MKKQVLKKLSAFIIIIMVFSALPKSINAQRNCPPDQFLVCDQYGKHCKCIKFLPPPCRGCGIALASTTGSQLSPISFYIEKPGKVSVKIYDVTGRLIKTLAEENKQQGEHQIVWNNKDENRNKVSAGIYLLQFDSNKKPETKKISVIN